MTCTKRWTRCWNRYIGYSEEMLPRIKTGLAGLDGKIKGGFPEGSSILVYGPPKCGKTIFSTQFFYRGLEEEEPGIYAITGMPITQLKQMMMSLNLSLTAYEEKKFVFYIDLFSIRSGSASDTDMIKNIAPENFTGLMVALSAAQKLLCPKAMRIRTVIDGLTQFIDINLNALKRVCPTMIARNKLANATTLITYTEGTADMQTETLFKSMVDGAIHLDGKGGLVVESMPATSCPIHAKYKITEKGMVIS